MKLATLALIATFTMTSTLLAQATPKSSSVPLGSPDFLPTPANPIGWRGDGTGIYPGDPPPKTWGVIVNGPFGTAHYQPAKPAGDKPAPDAHDFNPNAPHLTDFLLLGPFPGDPDSAASLTAETVPNESALAGEEGKSVKDSAWKIGYLPDKDPNEAKKDTFWTAPNQVAYAHAYLYFEQAGTIDLSIEHQAGMKIWLNGKEVYAEPKAFKYAPGRGSHWKTITVDKGWNRLLCKLVHADSYSWFRLMGMPTKVAGYANQNIQWSASLPEYSQSTPVVVGDRVFTTSEPSDLFCYDKYTGKLLWVQSTLAWYAAEADEKEAATKEFSADRSKIDRLEGLNAVLVQNGKIDLNARKALERDILDTVGKSPKYNYHLPGWGGGNSAPTPCTDGKVIYAWHGEAGTLGCYALDGTRQWVRYIHPIGKGDGSHHGVNGSPVICGDVILIPGWGCIIGADRHTGKELWNLKYDGRAYSTPVTDKIAGTDIAIWPTGRITQVSDGKILQPDFKGRYDGECASTAIDRVGRYFAVQNWGEVSIARTPDKLDAGPVTVTGKIPAAGLDYMVCSPLIDGGLVYYVGTKATLRVADAATGKLVYEKKLPLYPATGYGPEGAGVGASLTKVGKEGNLYVFDNRGNSLIFAPGREYKQLALNRLQAVTTSGENQEVFQATPIFDGPRMYVRGYRFLYCISESPAKASAK